MTVSIDDIFAEFQAHPDYGVDVKAIARRIVKLKRPVFEAVGSQAEAERVVMNYAAGSCAIYIEIERGRFYDKEKHGDHETATARQRIEAFKDYQRLWASRKNEGNDYANWCKMQDEMAQWFVDNGMATLV